MTRENQGDLLLGGISPDDGAMAKNHFFFTGNRACASSAASR
jgi:hypothetical protein